MPAGFLIKNNISIWIFPEVIINLLPAAAIFGVPMSILFGAIIGIGRLSADSEITAFRVNDVPLSRFIKPVLMFATFVLFIDLLIAIYWLPYVNNHLSLLYKKIISSCTLTRQICRSS